jgi:hypothetical protein
MVSNIYGAALAAVKSKRRRRPNHAQSAGFFAHCSMPDCAPRRSAFDFRKRLAVYPKMPQQTTLFRAARTLSLASAVWACAAHLHAQPPNDPNAKGASERPYDARVERLQGLTRAELGLLEPQLQAGPVALIEFTPDDDDNALPGINVAAIVHAPARDVMALVQKPEAYPRFMHTLDQVDIVERTGQSVVYDWRWQLALLTFEGRNSMTVFAPPPERADAGYRATIDSQSGDLGTGRISIRVLPRGERESLLCISMRIDLRNANYVARELATAGRSINRSANMSLAYAMILSLRREAERRAGFAPEPARASELHKPAFDEKALRGLLDRGDLVFLDMSGDHLNQIASFGLIHWKRALVHDVMLDADAFGSALLPGSEAKVVSKEGVVTTFDWDIDLPLVGVSGRMRMADHDPLVAVDAVKGALEGGRWNFETHSLGKNATIVATWASFDVRNSTWFVRKLADTDPYLGHGLTAASEVMLVRALRTNAGKLAEQRAATPTAAR